MKGSDGKWHLASQVKGLRFAPPAQLPVTAIAASLPPLPAHEPIPHLIDPPNSTRSVSKSEAEMIQPAPAAVIQTASPIITCPECGEQIKHAVNVCPACGYPIEPSTGTGSRSVEPVIILEERPVDRDQVGPLPAQPHAHATDPLGVAKAQAGEILNDLRHMDFRNEIVPLDESNFFSLIHDWVFWSVALLGVVPLLIVTLPDEKMQLLGLALFFAAVWGVIFRSAIVKDDASWKFLLAAMFFTGILGTVAAGMINISLLGEDFPEHEGYLSSLFKCVFVVGFCEELCKLVPAIAYLIWKRTAARPMTVVLLGVFSGLGFAAFENLEKATMAILQTAAATNAGGIPGLAAGVQGAMVMAMVRSLSLVFCHAVWAGMFAYFLARASLSNRRWGALFIVGLCVSAFLHGTYDWFDYIQPSVCAIIAAASFMLFYAYVAKLRAAIATSNKSDLPAVTVVQGVATS